MKNPLPRFVALTRAWLPVGSLSGISVRHCCCGRRRSCRSRLRGAFSDLVRSVDAQGAIVVGAHDPEAPTGRSGVRRPRGSQHVLYSFGAADVRSAGPRAREPRWPRPGNRLRVLLPVVAWGVVADFRKNVAITAGPMVSSQPGFRPLQREVIVFAFQFGSLILPTVVPAAVWVLTHRRFLERLRAGYPAPLH